MATTANTYTISYPYTVTGGTTASSTYTINSTSGAYTSTTPSFYSTNHKSVMSIPAGEEKVVLEKDATLEVRGNVVINGIDLEERLNTIEKVLQIPQRDVIMEAKYPKLAEIYNSYMQELERY